MHIYIYIYICIPYVESLFEYTTTRGDTGYPRQVPRRAGTLNVMQSAGSHMGLHLYPGSAKSSE